MRAHAGDAQVDNGRRLCAPFCRPGPARAPSRRPLRRCVRASRSVMARDTGAADFLVGLLSSSVTGRSCVALARARGSASSAIITPTFISRMPGPKMRCPRRSVARACAASVPMGQTVSRWPSSSTRPRLPAEVRAHLGAKLQLQHIAKEPAAGGVLRARMQLYGPPGDELIRARSTAALSSRG